LGLPVPFLALQYFHWGFGLTASILPNFILPLVTKRMVTSVPSFARVVVVVVVVVRGTLSSSEKDALGALEQSSMSF